MKNAFKRAYKQAYQIAGVVQNGSLLNQNEPEVAAYISGLATPLSSGQISKLNTFVASLKSGLGISALSDAFDVMYVLGNETAEAGLRNLVKRAHDATAVNSPSFTATEGFKSNGVSSYIKTGYNPNLEKVTFGLDHSSFGVYLRSQEAGTYCDIGCDSSGNRIYFLRNRLSTEFVCLNSLNVSAIARTTILGMNIVSRIDSAKATEYYNGGKTYDIAAASTTIPNKEIFLSAFNDVSGANLFSPRQISFAFAGKGLSLSEAQSITNAFEAYMDSNGKGVIA